MNGTASRGDRVAPPYVGYLYEEGRKRPKRIRRRSHAVILLDETEKAHPRRFQYSVTRLSMSDDWTDGKDGTSIHPTPSS